MAKKTGATAAILEFARQTSDGIVKWSEVDKIYCSKSTSKKLQYYRGRHMNIGRIFNKYFVKVEGVRGYWMLEESIVGED